MGPGYSTEGDPVYEQNHWSIYKHLFGTQQDGNRDLSIVSIMLENGSTSRKLILVTGFQVFLRCFRTKKGMIWRRFKIREDKNEEQIS